MTEEIKSKFRINDEEREEENNGKEQNKENKKVIYFLKAQELEQANMEDSH